MLGHQRPAVRVYCCPVQLSAVGTELDAIAATVIAARCSPEVSACRRLAAGRAGARSDQTFISFEGTLSSWWTKIVIGFLLLVFVVLQRFLVRSPD